MPELTPRRRIALLLALAALLAVGCVIVYGTNLWTGGEEAPAAAAREQPAGAPEAEDAAGGDDEVSYGQALALARSPDETDLPALRRHLESASWKTRHAAVKGIARVGDPDDARKLLARLTDRKERAEVRAAAAEALGALRHIPAGEALIDALKDPSLLVRIRAGVALRRIMGVAYGYNARAPAGERRKKIELIRTEWGKFQRYMASRGRGKGAE